MRRAGAAVLVVAAALVVALAVLLVAVSRPASDAPGATPAPGERPTAAPADVAPGELWLADMDLEASDVLTENGRLHDVRMRAGDVLLGEQGLVAGSLTVDAVVPFDVVAAQVGPGTTLAPAGERLRITRTVTLLGRAVDLSATATVRAQDGLVVAEPASVDVGGPAWLEEALGSAAARLVTVRQPVEGLPPSLVLQRVSVTEQGFAAHLEGRDVALGR
ncbi:MAG: LmeA family phospholipid-binding protein [Actinomycetes bacterium]